MDHTFVAKCSTGKIVMQWQDSDIFCAILMFFVFKFNTNLHKNISHKTYPMYYYDNKVGITFFISHS